MTNTPIPTDLSEQPARRDLLAVLSNGVTIGLLEVLWWISLLTLIFSGPMSDYIGRGAVFLVLGAAVGAGIISYRSSWRGTIAMPQDVPAAILAIATAQIAANISADVAQSAIFATVIIAIGISSIATGFVFILLGQLKLGNLVRILPYPVMAGFLGGTGWLLFTSGITSSVSPAYAGTNIFEPEALRYWPLSLLVALVIYLVGLRISHPLLVPSMIVLAVAAFFGVSAAMGVSIEQLTAEGWLIGALPSGNQIQLLSLSELQSVQWAAIAAQAGPIAILSVASAIAMLLNNSGFELTLGADFDNNRDLRVTGVANVLGGLLGGWPTYTALSWSNINAKDKQQKPLTTVILIVVGAALLVFATQLLAYLPRMVGGAMVTYMGIDFLYDWVFKPAKRLPWGEYTMLLLIVFTIALFGLVEGVVAGLIMAVLLFVFSYGRISVVRYQISGKLQKSRVTRSPEQQEYLKSIGEQTQILSLQGYLFFGTANGLLQQAREVLHAQEVRHLVLDFTRVSGIDSTARLMFVKLYQQVVQSGAALSLVGISAETRSNLLEEFEQAETPDLHFFTSRDKALQSIEETQLRVHEIDLQVPPNRLRKQLQRILPEIENIEQLLNLMEMQTLETGHYLMRQADAPSDMFFIESGVVTAQIQREDGAVMRLETMGSGRVVGELGFYLGQARTADVVSETEAVVYRLSKARLAELEASHPKVASTLHQLIVHLLSERVTHLVGVVDRLQN